MSTQVPELRAGSIVGSYCIEEPLARGGMGCVYAATHLVLPRRAAIKVLHKNLMGRCASEERLLQEARILETLAGPRVSPVYDAGTLPDGRPWVAMELLEGTTLADMIDTRGALPPLEVARIILAVTDALATAHRHGVIHRDIKPDNIIVSGDRVTVIDWGVARMVNARPITEHNTVPGTPQYMAPEQLHGHPVAAGTDTYALGIVAYEMLVGEPPFCGRSAVETAFHQVSTPPLRIDGRVPGLPFELDELVLAMRAPRPDARPSLDAVRARLRTIIDVIAAADYDELSIVAEMEDVDVDFDDLVDSAGELDLDMSRGETMRMRWTPELLAPVVVSASLLSELHTYA